MKALVLVLWASWAAWASISLEWEGRLAWALPDAVSLSADFTLGWEGGGWRWSLASSFSHGAWTKLSLAGKGRLGEVEVLPSLEFDPQAQKFLGGKALWSWDGLGLDLLGVAKLEEKGFGWGLELKATGSPLERVRIRFNLKRFLDEVLDPTFSPSFSFLEARFSLPLPCCIPKVRGRLIFSKSGFDELSLGFSFPGGLECGFFLWAHVRVRAEEKEVRLFPGVLYQGPQGLFLFLRAHWEDSTLQGIELYGIWIQGEVEGIKFNVLTSLAPKEVPLVKPPFFEKVEVKGRTSGCCGGGKWKTTLYFGDQGLFGLGEVEIKAEAPLGENFVLIPGFAWSVPDHVSVELGWKAAF